MPSSPTADFRDWADRVVGEWPFLAVEQVLLMRGRVDRLYHALLAHGISRGDAALQLHRFLKAAPKVADE